MGLTLKMKFHLVVSCLCIAMNYSVRTNFIAMLRIEA